MFHQLTSDRPAVSRLGRRRGDARRRLLGAVGRICEVGSGLAALSQLDRATANEIDLVILQFAMPGMNGAEAAKEACRYRPGLPVMFVIGYADTAALRRAKEATEDIVILQPFRDGDLARNVEVLLRTAGERGNVNAMRRDRPVN
jgi:CheY-like chemotaxis protein